jgi:hypothetical protein
VAIRPNIHRVLGATHPTGASQVVLFIPDLDRAGKSIDQEYWIEEGLRAMGRLFRGATAFPRGHGVWRDDDAEGKLLEEQTVMIVSYVDPRLLTSATLRRLREFLHRFGRETRQGEVGIVIDSKYYGISTFDSGQE